MNTELWDKYVSARRLEREAKARLDAARAAFYTAQFVHSSAVQDVGWAQCLLLRSAEADALNEDTVTVEGAVVSSAVVTVEPRADRE